MGVWAFRVAACVGALVTALMIGDTGAGPAAADPGLWGHGQGDKESSKNASKDGGGRHHWPRRTAGERAGVSGSQAGSSPRAKFGSKPESSLSAGTTEASRFAGADERRSAPAVAPAARGAEPDGSAGVGTEGNGFGVDHEQGGIQPAAVETGARGDQVDNTVVSVGSGEQKKPNTLIGRPYPILQIRLGSGNWWHANRIIGTFQQVISSLVPVPPKPEPTPAPAYRIGAAEPEPVLDASGGVAGGGSDYQPLAFGGSPVLQAPIIAAPVPPIAEPVPALAAPVPPAAVRLPAAPPVAATGAGTGLAAPRAGEGEPVPIGAGIRTGEQSSAGTVTSMSSQTPRQSYSNYLRTPGLPQMAGAALPGVAGIVLMTLMGGVIGHRQASAGRMVRMSGAARYLP